MLKKKIIVKKMGTAPEKNIVGKNDEYFQIADS